jgi:PKD repeat protein
VSFTSASGTSYAEYGPAGFTPGSGTVVSPAASPLSISGLTAGTNYEVYVYDVCTGDTSLPAGPLAVSTASSPKPTASFVWTVTPTLTNATAAFDASGSTGGTTYSWDFGNSSTGTGVNANGTYTANGTYNVTLIVSNACGSDTLTQAVTVNGIGVAEAALAASFQAYPNPTRGKVALSFSLMYSNAATIEIMDLSGRVVWVESAEVNGTYHKELDLSSYAAGVYLVRVSSEDGVVARRLIVE